MSDPIAQAIDDHLAAFARNPVEAMDAPPPKFGADGLTAFTDGQIERAAFVGARDALRRDLMAAEAASPARAPFETNDRAENLVDAFHYASLSAMDGGGVTAASLPISPWSDDYWPIYLGQLGWRYADPDFPASGDWKTNYDYIMQARSGTVPAGSDPAATDLLSPAEKYDLLVGDDAFSLTHAMWETGRHYYDLYGEVESWMGLCHGWAPAAYMLERPPATVEVIGTRGEILRFHSSDIKGLATLLWANTRTRTRFIGGRCNVKDPARDPATGRVVAQDCFDTNPASWHMAVVNQIGASQRSMVMDATFDYQVWNQPVLSYGYRYFNTQAWRYADTLAAATTPMEAFTTDRFAGYRSAAAVSVVGIAMDVSYLVETRANTAASDGPDDDAVQRVRYYYDIEQDAAGRAIGGEWYTNKHPDFLWTPPAGEKATTPADAWATGFWQQGEAVPVAWQDAARQASAVSRAPLSSVVERLIAFSKAAASL